MTNQTETIEAQAPKQESQKFGTQNQFTKAQKAEVIYAPNWNPPPLAKIELIADPDARRQACYNAYESIAFDVFVRACPLTPRPGVLESTRATTFDEVLTIVNRITETMLGPDPDLANPLYEHGLCDPDGCIMLMPYIDATASAVVAPYSYVTVGEGNAGVTSPHGGFQIVMGLSESNDTGTRKALEGLDIDPAKIELEFVHRVAGGDLNTAVHSSTKQSNNWGRTHIVQLRGADAGHKDIRSPPHPFEISGFVQGGIITVKEVIALVTGSEEECARLEVSLRGHDLDGLVITHADGSPLSHAAGQCSKWGVTYIVSDKPKVGDTWVEVDGWGIDDPTIEPQPFNQYHWREFFDRGLAVGMSKFARQYGWLSNHFHQFIGGAVMNSPRNTAFLAGVFAGYLPTAILSVSMGEMRYMGAIKKDTLPINTLTLMALNKGLESDSFISQNRRHYYTLMEKQPMTIQSLLGQLQWLYKMYATGWEGSGYGGKDTYGDATRKAIDVVQHIIKYAADPSEDNFRLMFGIVNEAENIAHNNGFFLNKFISKRAFDIGTDPTLVSAFYPDDFFAVYGAASHAYQYFNGFDKVEKRDTTAITDYAMAAGANQYHHQKDMPVFLQKDHPFSEFNVHKAIDHLHPSKSKYGGDHESKFVPCGSEHCDKCKQMAYDKVSLQAMALMQLPLPTNLPHHDMTLPLPVNTTVTHELPPYCKAKSSVLLAIFKGHVYEPTTFPNIQNFLEEAKAHNLQDNLNPVAQRLVKHYASFLENAPLEYKTGLTEYCHGKIWEGEE